MNYNGYPDTGVDMKIRILQNILHKHLNWPQVDFFGRVHRVGDNDGKTVTPEFYSSISEGRDVYLDDKKNAGTVFFIDSLQHKPKGVRRMEADVKVVFMLDLSKLTAATAYRPDSEVQEKVKELIRRSGVFEGLGLQKGLKEVLSGFTTKELKQYDEQKYHVFAVTGKIIYNT